MNSGKSSLVYIFALSGSSSAWLERCVRDAEVAGSNPVSPIASFALLLSNLGKYAKMNVNSSVDNLSRQSRSVNLSLT